MTLNPAELLPGTAPIAERRGRIVRPLGGEDDADPRLPVGMKRGRKATASLAPLFEKAAAELVEESAPRPRIAPFATGDAKGDVVISREKKVPKGHYDRSKAKSRAKKAGAESTEAPNRRRRTPRRAKVFEKNGATRRFGVFDDGSVQIDCESCKGNLSPEDATALVAFITGKKGKRG